MKIELKNINHSEFASHETFCYEANLYVRVSLLLMSGMMVKAVLITCTEMIGSWTVKRGTSAMHFLRYIVLISSDGNWVMDGVKVVLKPRVMS